MSISIISTFFHNFFFSGILLINHYLLYFKSIIIYNTARDRPIDQSICKKSYNEQHILNLHWAGKKEGVYSICPSLCYYKRVCYETLFTDGIRNTSGCGRGGRENKNNSGRAEGDLRYKGEGAAGDGGGYKQSTSLATATSIRLCTQAGAQRSEAV